MLMSKYYKMFLENIDLSNCNSKDEERGKEKDDPIFMIKTKYYFVTNILKNQSQEQLFNWLQYGIKYVISSSRRGPAKLPGTRYRCLAGWYSRFALTNTK